MVPHRLAASAPEPALLGIHYPCVLKPLSLSASQGVIRANNRAEFLAAAERIRRLLASPEIAAAASPSGSDHCRRIHTRQGSRGRGLAHRRPPARACSLRQARSVRRSFFEETIYVTPSRFPEAQQRAIADCAAEAVRALGLSHGPIHAEFRVNDGAVLPLEVAPRPIGGLCARALRFIDPVARAGSPAEPMGLEELLLRHTAELPGSNAARESSASAVMMIPVPGSGILESIAGENETRATANITELHITARLHDHIAAWPEGSSYLGFLFARANTPADAETALREAHAKLKFALNPRLPVEHPATRQMVE